MPDVDTDRAMEDMIRWNMSMQKGNLGLTGISKDDAALFLRDADIDASGATSIGELSGVKDMLTSLNSRTTSAGQQSHNLTVLRGSNQPLAHVTSPLDDPHTNTSSMPGTLDIFARGSLFQFDSINADESSHHVDTEPIDSVHESEHYTAQLPESQAQQLAEVEQSCKDSYMKTYQKELNNALVKVPKRPASRRRKIKKRRTKSFENQPSHTEQPHSQSPSSPPQVTDVDTEEKLARMERKKSEAPRGRRLEGAQKKKGMLDLSNQHIDLELSISSSDSSRDIHVAEREAPAAPKTAVITAPPAPKMAASVIIQNINTVQKEEADAKVYSVQPMAQRISDGKHPPLSRKNVQQNNGTDIDDGAEVNQLRKFSVIQPPERFHEVVAGREMPSHPDPIEPEAVNIYAAQELANNVTRSAHDTPGTRVDTDKQNNSIVNELIESINLQESINEHVKVIGVGDIRKSQRRLRRSTTAIDQAIQRNMSLISSGVKSSNLLNIVPNSREHTSDPSRFPISVSPREALTGARSLDHQSADAKSMDNTLSIADLQPAHRLDKIVLTPPPPLQRPPEVSKDGDQSNEHIGDASGMFTIADTTDYLDQTESYRQSGSFSTKVLANESIASGLVDEPVEPSRKKQKRMDMAHLNHSTIDSYFKKEMYDEIYGSYKLRNFLTSGTGLTLEEIRRRYGVPVMNAKKVRDIKLENIPVDHSLLPRDHSTGRIILPELDKAIGEGLVYAYPSGGEPYILSVKVAFIPNKPPRPKRQQQGGLGANLEDSQLFIKKQSERIQRTIQRNNLTVNEDAFWYTNRSGSQSINIFRSFSGLSFEYFHGLQMARIVEERADGKRSNGAMLWHLYGASQSDRITSSGYCITQLSQGWAKFSLYGNTSAKEGELTEYTTGQYESVTIPRGIKFFLSASPVSECYFLCCLVNI